MSHPKDSVCVLQVQKKNYRQEKKRAAKELSSALKDPSVVITANWLKVIWEYLLTHCCFPRMFFSYITVTH